MPQDVLQRHDVPTVHDEVTGERVTQHVAGLPLRQLDRGRQQHQAEHAKAVREGPVGLPMPANVGGQFFRDRHRAHTLGLGVGEDHRITFQTFRRQRLSLTPSSPCREADTSDHLRMWRRGARIQGRKQFGHLMLGQVRQRSFLKLERPHAPYRILIVNDAELAQFVVHGLEVAKTVVRGLARHAIGYLSATQPSHFRRLQGDSDRVAQVLCHQPQNRHATMPVAQGLAVQFIPEFDQLRETPTVLRPERPAGVFRTLLTRGGLELLRLHLGLEPLAKALALDRFYIDEPTAIGELGNRH